MVVVVQDLGQNRSCKKNVTRFITEKMNIKYHQNHIISFILLYEAQYTPQLTFGSPVNPLSQVQKGFPVAYTTWHTALVPLQIIRSHGSK